MYYPENVIDDIRIRNDIADVISGYVHLERRGRRLVGLCPFHGEKTPSFSVDPSKQFFYCFGCKKGGNVIQFVMGMENLEFPDALKLLAERAGIELPESSDDGERERSELRKEILRLNKEAARWFFSRLTGDAGAQAYLSGRGLTSKTVRQFGLGFSPDDWDGLSRHLQAAGADTGLIERAGLATRTQNGRLIDSFRNRIMFPIFDIRGNIIGFGGRVMDGTQPKYKNSTDTPVYNKSRELYALNFARTSTSKRLLLVEGYMDVLSMHQAGVDYAVASLGTALTRMQAWVLKKYAEEIILCYDADQAGQNATLRALEVLEEAGCKTRVLQIPDGKDPDEFVRRNGADKLIRLIEESSGVLAYRVQSVQRQTPEHSVEDRILLLNRLADTLAAHENAIERDLMARRLSAEYLVSLDALNAEIGKRLKQNRKSDSLRKAVPASGPPVKPPDLNRYDEFEMLLVILVCESNRLYETMMLRYPPERFKGSVSAPIARKMADRLMQHHECALAELLNELDANHASALLNLHETRYGAGMEDKALDDLVNRLDRMHLEDEKNWLLACIRTETDPERRKELSQSLSRTIARLAGNGT